MRAIHGFAKVIAAWVLSSASPALGQETDTFYTRLVGRWAEYRVRDHRARGGQIMWMDEDSLVVRPRPGRERTTRILVGDLTRLRVRQAVDSGVAGPAEGKRRERWESINAWDRPSSRPLQALVNRWIRFRVGQGGFEEGRIVGVGNDSIVVAPGGHQADAMTIARGELSEVFLSTTHWRQWKKGGAIGSALGGVGAAVWALIALPPDPAWKPLAVAFVTIPGGLVGGLVGTVIGGTKVQHSWRPLEPPVHSGRGARAWRTPRGYGAACSLRRDTADKGRSTRACREDRADT